MLEVDLRLSDLGRSFELPILLAAWADDESVSATFSEIITTAPYPGSVAVRLVARPGAKLWKDHLVALLAALKESLQGTGVVTVTDLVSGRPWAGGPELEL